VEKAERYEKALLEIARRTDELDPRSVALEALNAAD
jgi:hypothetical protein